MFAETSRSQHRIDTLFVSVRRLVREEGVDLGNRRRQAGQGERSPTEQGGAIGGDGRFETGFGGLVSDEGVERILGPRGISDRWRCVRRRADERPVRIVFSPLLDPATQNVLLGGGERPMQLRRWHDFLGVGREDAMDHRAFLQVARDDRDVAALELLRCAANFIETQTGLAAFIRIGSVAAVATIGENRSDFAIKVHRRICRPGERRRHCDEKG